MCRKGTIFTWMKYVGLIFQITFRTIMIDKMKGPLGLLARFYKGYLDILSFFVLYIGFYIPQGSLVYWTTNSFFTLFQQLALKHPYVRSQLGLPEIVSQRQKNSMENISPKSEDIVGAISPDSLSPEQLLEYALQDMAAGNYDRALTSLRTVIERDPDLVRAQIAVGQIMYSRTLFSDAANHFDQAISKISDEDHLLILASFGAALSHNSLGNKEKGIAYLKKIAEMKEPENPMDKACYYQGLVMLGSILFNDGEKAEAAKYLRMAATYDPSVLAYLKECVEGTEDQQNTG